MQNSQDDYAKRVGNEINRLDEDKSDIGATSSLTGFGMTLELALLVNRSYAFETYLTSMMDLLTDLLFETYLHPQG